MSETLAEPNPANQDMLKLFRLFRRHVRFLILSAVAGLLLSFAGGVYLKPKLYSADVLLFIWQSRDDSQQDAVTASDLNLYSQLVYDYQALVKSRLVTRLVADDLGMTPAEYEQLAGKISVATKENTRHITIAVIDKDPEAAAVIANTIAKYFSESVVEKMGAANVQIIDPAVVPERPVASGASLILVVGALVGLMLGAGAILLITSLDTTVRTADDVASLTGFKLLGFIHTYEQTPASGRDLSTHGHVGHGPVGHDASARGHDGHDGHDASARGLGGLMHGGRAHAAGSVDLVTRRDPRSPISESFKSIRTGIEYTALDRRIRSLVVTSTQQDEAKSVTLANLAITYAQLGRRVLLLDADLHMPVLHACFGLENNGGLTAVLTGEGHFSEYVQPTGTDGLSILSSGAVPLNPADLLDSRTMTDLLGELMAHYDLVLIDSPPVGLVSDAAILAARADATLFIVRAGATSQDHLKRAAYRLEQMRAHVIGYVMNGISRKSDDYMYAGGRFVRSPHTLLQRSRDALGMMKAAPLLKQPAASIEAELPLQPAERRPIDLEADWPRER